MELDINLDLSLMSVSLAIVLLPQAFANLVTGLAGFTPGKIYFGWLIELIIGIFAKSLVSFSAVEIALLLYSWVYNLNADVPNRYIKDACVVFASVGIAASGMIFLALSVDPGGYVRILKRAFRKPIRRWLRFAMRNRRRAERHRRPSLPAKRLRFSLAVLLRFRSGDMK